MATCPPNYLRAEVDRLSFGITADLAGGQDTRPAGAVALGPQGAAPFAASLLQAPNGASNTPSTGGANLQDLQAVTPVQDLDAASTPALSLRERAGGRTRGALFSLMLERAPDRLAGLEGAPPLELPSPFPSVPETFTGWLRPPSPPRPAPPPCCCSVPSCPRAGPRPPVPAWPPPRRCPAPSRAASSSPPPP